MPGQFIDFPPPVKGIDESLPARAQGDLTCPDALNACSVPTLSGNLTVGKRDGFGRAFINAAGGGSGAPGSGLVAALRASSTAPTVVGNYQPVVERWTGYQIDTAYSGFLIGTNLRGEYVRFSRKVGADYGTPGWQASSVPPDNSIVLVRSGSSFTVNHASALSDFADVYGIGLASTFNTSNDMTLQFNSYPRARDAADFIEAHNVGPFVRGHPNLGYYVWAFLDKTAENEVRLTIQSVEGASVNTIATGSAITLPGSATLSNNQRIRLVATTTGLEARLTWPDVLGTEEVVVSAASARGAFTAYVAYSTLAVSTFQAGEVVTQATSGATGIVLEDVTATTTGYLVLWVTSGTFNGTNGLTGGTSGATATATGTVATANARAGWFFKNPSTSFPGTEPGYFRRISGMDFSKLVPPEPEVVAEILKTNTLTGAARYLMPPNWEGIDVDVTQTGAELYRIIGGTLGYSQATAPRVPSVDTIDRTLLGPNTSPTARSGLLTPELFATVPPTEFYEVETRLNDVNSSQDDRIGAFFFGENLHE